MRAIEIISPKQDLRLNSQWDGFFPYYAGYPERFASAALGSIGLMSRSVVLDPWSGSGTTPYAAVRLGLDSIGLDINPAMTVIAKARLLPSSEASALVPLGNQILASYEFDADENSNEPLGVWFGPRTASYLRGIEREIRRILIGRHLDSEDQVGSISCIASALYVALFSVTRLLAARFKGSNPTWLRAPKHGEIRIAASKAVVEENFKAQLLQMASALASQKIFRQESNVEIGFSDSTCLSLGDATVDAVLTSPPYCTRIDYASTTRVELAILQGLLPSCHVDLGRRMLGSVRVPQKNIDIKSHWGATCRSFLNEVANHSSKASASYYLKTHLDYYDKLDRSMSEISRVLKKNSLAILVVQDSFYKDVHNNLPQIVTEIASAHNLSLIQRCDFPLKRSMAAINKGSRAYRSKSNAVEVVLCFNKD